MKRLIVLLLAAAGLLCAGTAGAQKAGKGETVKVMSFNIRQSGVPEDGVNGWEHRKVACIAMIREEAPDLIGMQEVLPEQVAYLAERLTEYGMVGVGRDDGKEEGEHMTVLYRLDRFGFPRSGNFWLSETPDKVSRGWDGACNRMCSWVVLKDLKAGCPVALFNTHLDHVGQEAREKGAGLLVSKIGEITGPGTAVFVTGDFNAAPGDPVLAPLFKKFRAARDKAPVTDRHGTFNGWGNAPSNIVLDHIFYRDAKPQEFRVVTKEYGHTFVSDHYPILATFKL